MVAFARDLSEEVTPVAIGRRRLMIVRRNGMLRAFDATCPHRGAHLACGGRLAGDAHIRCPFHGYMVRLGGEAGAALRVAEHPVLALGGMVFVRTSTGHDNGWADRLEAIVRDHRIVNGFEMTVRVPMSIVIENAFDQRHFHAVHGVQTDGFSVHAAPDGALVVESTFHVPDAGGRAAPPVAAPYRAVVASPGLAAVTLGGPTPYTVITGATDGPDGSSTIRLSLAFPTGGAREPPTEAFCEALLQHSRRGLEEDRAMWESLEDVEPVWMPEDGPTRAFLAFRAAHLDA